jgi:hypothetical protein
MLDEESSPVLASSRDVVQQFDARGKVNVGVPVIVQKVLQPLHVGAHEEEVT